MNGAGLEEAGKGGGEVMAVTLEDLRKKMGDFARERGWEQFHSPRNLLLAMVGEVGELSEIFQWKGEVPKGLPGWEARETEHLGEELADVLLYLVRLSDMCGVDLGRAALRKMELNALKYPAGQCRGAAKNCTDDDCDKASAGGSDEAGASGAGEEHP
ncbi:uncharacterized protein LOC133924026 [Phragmites australis]|uniref:uncharacterized protein LOC133924026 n=1 Tax=Phragmites australis TaxID=29695 RepID=UPI002D76AC9E|nr:uncharacterized protein LOC133924026 [Phragmites australis]